MRYYVGPQDNRKIFSRCPFGGSVEKPKSRAYGLRSSCFLETQRAVPLEYTKQLLPLLHSALPRAQRAAPVKQQLSASTYCSSAGTGTGSTITYNSSTEAHGAAVSPENKKQLCWSTWSSSSLGADTAAPVEHIMKQRLSGSRNRCSSGAGAEQLFPGAALCVQVELLSVFPESSCSIIHVLDPMAFLLSRD